MPKDTVREMVPHSYWPNYQAMGECEHCGREQSDPIEDLGETTREGDLIFADYVCLDWWPGRWLPRYTRHALKLNT